MVIHAGRTILATTVALAKLLMKMIGNVNAHLDIAEHNAKSLFVHQILVLMEDCAKLLKMEATNAYVPKGGKAKIVQKLLITPVAHHLLNLNVLSKTI